HRRGRKRRAEELQSALETQQRVLSALEAWTDDLLPIINILGNDGLDDEHFATTVRDFNAVQHLFFVPQILDVIDPFQVDDSVNSDPPPLLGERYNPTVPLSASLFPTLPIPPLLASELADEDHPGPEWALFDAGN